jgi:hypothetical protein
MAAKASSARRDIHASLTWLNLGAYTIRSASAEPLRRVYSHSTSRRPRRQRIRA